jgi:hypothetical protein
MLPFILLPNYCKYLGVLLYTAGFALLYLFNPNLDDFSNGLGLGVQVMILLGLLIIACSRQKVEDEFMQHYRLVALQWSVVIFIAVRLIHKLMAYLLDDASWLPEGIQINFLLLVYVCMFHYFAVVKDRLFQVFGKKGGGDEE